MIDTVELILSIEREEYMRYFRNLRKYSKNKGFNLHLDHKSSNEICKKYVTKACKDKGIRRIYLYRNKIKLNKESNFTIYYVGIILQPIILLQNYNYYDVCAGNQMLQAEKEFSKQLKIIFGEECSLLSLFYWHPNRIDYAINVEFENSHILENYIKLFQRANIPCEFKECYIKENHRRGQREGSFYLLNKEYVHINFYNKFNQIMNRAKKKNNTLVVEKRNVIRFEIQCFQSKVNNIKFSKGFKSRELLYFLNPDLCEGVILNYYNKTLGFGDYYTFDNAVKLIEKLRIKTKTKEQMIEILQLVRQKKSIVYAKNVYITCHEKGEDRFWQLVNKLNLYGINPVTIPNSWEVSEGFLANPIIKIKNTLDLQKHFKMEYLTNNLRYSYIPSFEDKAVDKTYVDMERT